MKYGAWIVLVAALTFAVMYVLKPPFLLFLLMGVPVLTIGLTMAFLAGTGIPPAELPLSEFRTHFLKSIQEFKDDVLRRPFWPAKLVFWVVTRYGRKHCRRVEEQSQSGFLS
ncbi:MAG: hypothetical protein A2Y56_08760 [Candidatus Aminicenantes bacterium RBG_13_63_10]|nr:MAG: hypothetical protein A2Y56_08760 [Candidatus Aminicenantes bacterium RBG_13_63_10]